MKDLAERLSGVDQLSKHYRALLDESELIIGRPTRIGANLHRVLEELHARFVAGDVAGGALSLERLSTGDHRGEDVSLD